MGLSAIAQPTTTEIEITIIGPSFGESICIHPGGGRWWVIDCCLNPQTKRPAPLEYLESLGIDVEQQVDLVVTTHWHGDHIGGLARLLAACPQARFCLSSALTSGEFQELVAQYQSNPPATVGSRLGEFADVLNQLRGSGRTGRRANQGRVLHRLEPRSSGHGQECVITSLSPSDFSEQLFIEEMVSLMPAPLEPKRPVPSLTPNEASVALWLEIGEKRVLLGADLEDSADDRRGWKAFLQADNCPLGRAEFVKVPHHGSQNAHNDRLWSERIQPNPIAVTTPWELGRGRLPTPEDAARLRSLTMSALTTSVPANPRLPRRHPAVQRQLKESGVALRPIRVGIGAVRCRMEMLGRHIWCVEFLGSAGPT
jgi:hypothetical protein